MTIHLSQVNSVFFITAFLGLLLSLFVWNRRQLSGASSLVMLLVSIAIWMFGMAMQSGLSEPGSILFWFKVQISGLQFLAHAWLFFVFQYLGIFDTLSRKQKWLLGIPPIATVLLLWSNDLHYLFWKPGFTLELASSLPAVQLFGPAQWISTFFRYLYLMVATFFLIQNVSKNRQNNTYTTLLLLACMLPAWLIDMYLLAFPRPGWLSQNAHFIYLACVGLFLTALFRYRLLNVLPIAFETLIAEMSDAMLILDANKSILHLNPSAQRILGVSGESVVGKPAPEVLANYPALLRLCNQSNQENSGEITLSDADHLYYFEVVVTPIRDRWHNLTGHILVLHNITNRVKAEASSRLSQALLHRSEETYRQLVENINEVIFVLDAQLVLSYISPVIERYIGFHPAEMNGQSFDRFVHPEDLPTLQTCLKSALQGENTTCDFRLIDKSEQEHYVHANYHRLMQEAQVTGLQGMLTDVTEYRHAQDAMERQALQLAMLNHIGEQIAAVMELDDILNSATRLIRSNFGYHHVALFLPDHEQGTLVMRSASGAFASIFPPNHRLKLGQGIIGWVAETHNLLLANDVNADTRYINFFPDKIVTLSELAVPVMLYDELVGILDIQSPQLNGFNENDVRVLKTVADQIAVAIGNARLYEQLRLQLKEREQKENILRIQRDILMSLSSFTHLEEMLQDAVKRLSFELKAPVAAILLLDSSGTNLRVAASIGTNQYAEDIVPLTIGVVGRVAKTCQPILLSDVREAPYYRPISTNTRSEICTPLVAGSRVIGVINLESPVINGFSQDSLRLLNLLASSLVVLIERARLFDEVERARAELEARAMALEAANERLRELDRLKSQFLANMSHELRTPLNSIIGFSEVIYDEVTGPINDDQREYIRYIYESGKHLLALINDLLDFSKIEAGRMQLELTPFHVEDVLEEVRSLISPQIEKKEQQLFFHICPDLPPIMADRLRMRQVFLNLLSNANKFTPAGGSIRVNCERDPLGRIRIAIQDNGIGIRPEDQDKIFEEFRQVDGSLTREVAGTGLGLAISKRIVELHHGFIWVESEYGYGSTFYISLPVNEVADMI